MKQKVTLVFPGQGSQYVGMGREFKDEFKIADSVLGYSLRTITLEGPNEELTSTKNTEPAILAHSVGLLNKLLPILDNKKIQIERVLGHSVGEYSALVAAGSLDFADALISVHYRGKFMQEAVPEGKGRMIALLKMPQEIIEKACKEASKPGSLVMPANFNEPNQIVISGCAEAAERAIKWLEENYDGRVKAIELNVSAPFHSSLMQPAAEKLEQHLSQIEFRKLNFPYIANYDAKEYDTKTDPKSIRQNLVKQVCGSVLWTQSLINLNPRTKFIEVGPGKVLSGLIKKINPEFKIHHLDHENGFEQLNTFLEE